jgi:hypothetical protein
MRKFMIGLALLLSACAPSQAQIETATAETEAAKPTATFQPTATVAPMATPEARNTLAATRTPQPTKTLLPPSETPEPITYTGTGDSIVAIERGSDSAILRVSGNADKNLFVIRGYDKNGQATSLHIATKDVYVGTKFLGATELTDRVEIEAVGDWMLEVLPIESARTLAAPGVVEGAGDDVIVLCCNTLNWAEISADASSSQFASNYFAVEIIYQPGGSELLVSEVAPFSDTLILKAVNMAVMEITAPSTWLIEIGAQ